jgi:regulatory protein
LRQPRLLDANSLREYAYRLLAGRALSAGEVRTKLTRKALDKTDVEAVLARLKDLGALDDKRFAQHFAERRKENEGFGRQRVLRDLRNRRVPGELAEKAVSSAFAGSDELALIEAFLARKYRGKDLRAHLAEEKHLASAFRRLRTAGFSAANSIQVLRRFSARASQIEETTDSNGESDL